MSTVMLVLMLSSQQVNDGSCSHWWKLDNSKRLGSPVTARVMMKWSYRSKGESDGDM